MGYCFMSLKKIHSMGELAAKYNHNYRIADVLNADPNLAYLNSELVKLPRDESGSKMDYNDFFKKRIGELDYYKSHSIKKNNVLAIEVLTTFSRQVMVPIEEWKQKNVEWLQKEFNKAGDGRNNIASVVYHGDENGNVHCHAIIIPINDKNILSAKFYTNGSRKLTELQTSYANAMKEFGLKRGLQGSSAKHRDIRKYYADLNEAIKVPEPEASESAIEYHNRVFEEVQTLQAAFMRQRDEAFARQRRKLDEERILVRQAIQRELDTAKEIQTIKLSKLQTAVHETEENLSNLNAQYDVVRKRLRYYGDPDELIQKAVAYDRMQACMQALEARGPEQFHDYKDMIDSMMLRLELAEEEYER